MDRDEELWKLKRENAELRKSLAQVLSQLVPLQYAKAEEDLAALGSTYVPTAPQLPIPDNASSKTK